MALLPTADFSKNYQGGLPEASKLIAIVSNRKDKSFVSVRSEVSRHNGGDTFTGGIMGIILKCRNQV